MHIAVIAHTHFPIRRPYDGGLEAHTHQLVNELVRQKHEVTLFAKFGSHTDAKLIKIFYGKHRNGRNPLLGKSYEYIMKRVALGNYDLIINNSLSSVPLIKHTEQMPPMVTIFHTPPLPKMVKALEASMPTNNRTYIAVSEFTAEQWRQHSPEPVKVITNGIDLSTWQSRQTNRPYFTASWVGRITPEKGTHLALQTCINMNLPITFAGCISDKKYFRSHIKPLLKNNLVTYMGHADRQQVNDIYRNSSVALVTPLWDEPFGLVAVEALASGTPIAAFARGGLASIITPSVGSLARDDTTASLRTAVEKACKKRRSTCSDYAVQNYSLEKMVGAYLESMPEVKQPEVDTLKWATLP